MDRWRGWVLGWLPPRREATLCLSPAAIVPLLRPALIARMFECLGDQEIVVPRDGERYYPLAAVYRIGVLTAVELALAAEKRSLTSLIELCRVRNVDVESLRDVDPNLSSFINCNSPDDYRRALLESGFW